MPDARYFLGYGERLTGRVAPPAGGGGPQPPYEFAEAVQRLAPRANDASQSIDSLPEEACPHGEAVGVMTMHPQAIAKSYYPAQLLNQFSLRHVGSRPVVVTPEKWSRKSEFEAVPSTDLYLAGSRDSFRNFALALTETPFQLSEQVRRIEDVRAPEPRERLRGLDQLEGDTANLEAVLHATDSFDDAFIVEAFGDFAETVGAQARLGKRIYAGGLCFIPVVAPVTELDRLAEFAFLRVARPVSRLRAITPIERSVPSPDLTPAPLPDAEPLDPDFRVAIFDGGLQDGSPLSRWAVAHDPDGIGNAVPDLQDHGHDVTCAFLFGPLVPGLEPQRPYCVADHFRVLDDESGADPFELYEVLRRIQTILEDRSYEFFNLSIGPAVPTEDDEVHPWTAVLDTHMSEGRSLATVAVGNWGERTEPDDRIQVPSDSVNATSVGAADSTRGGWSRAPYSSIGPGRSPGVIKPDVVEFGGCEIEPFLVYDRASAPSLARTCGTSFASPALLHQAVALRAHFGNRLSPLAIKALLIHAADAGGHDRTEVGWGKTPDELTAIAVCDDGMVRVIYQGELTPTQYLRALIPMPDQALEGFVTLRATFCYATPVDPEDPGNYTRSGLEVTFRPHAGQFNSGAVDPAPKPFFKRGEFDPERELRRDAQKWETTLHHEQRFRAQSLKDPVFDIHYNAREGGGPSREAERMRYALVVDVLSPRTPHLYDLVSAAFAGRLEALVPLIEIPVRV